MSDTEHNVSGQIGQPAPRCLRCHSNEADLQAFRCQSCGAEWLIELVYADSDEQYRRAEEVLRQANLLAAYRRPHKQTTGYVSVATQPGMLLIRPGDQIAVATHLEEAGVFVPKRGVPFIDREHPFCPRCEADVSRSEDSRCPECRKPFVWVDEHDDLFEISAAHTSDTTIEHGSADEQTNDGLPMPDIHRFTQPSKFRVGLARWYCDAISFFVVFISIIVLITTWTALPVAAVVAIAVSIMALYLRRPIRRWLRRVENGLHGAQMHWPE